MLKYLKDWDEVKDRYTKWWSREYFGRCAISITAPKDSVDLIKKPCLPDKIEDRWLDFDYLKAKNDFIMQTTYYCGEAFPLWNAGYPGWDFIAAFLGSKVDLKEETGWVHPLIEEGELVDYDFNNIKILPSNKWYKFAKALHEFAASCSYQKSIPSIQAIGGVGDILSGIRGSLKLLYDLMDYPEYVREFEMHLMKIWIEVYDEFYKITMKSAYNGVSNFFNLWAPGKFYAASNDFSYMISPKMYEDIFLPALNMQIDYLDYSIYHVDGINAFCHVDMLCNLPKLNAIQILPGAGKPSPLHYMDILKKVQKSDKNLHITIPPNEIKNALENLDARGLYINTYCKSEKEAKELLEGVGKWSIAK